MVNKTLQKAYQLVYLSIVDNKFLSIGIPNLPDVLPIVVIMEIELGGLLL
jgi:hypothetical protein